LHRNNLRYIVKEREREREIFDDILTPIKRKKRSQSGRDRKLITHFRSIQLFSVSAFQHEACKEKSL